MDGWMDRQIRREMWNELLEMNFENNKAGVFKNELFIHPDVISYPFICLYFCL